MTNVWFFPGVLPHVLLQATVTVKQLSAAFKLTPQFCNLFHSLFVYAAVRPNTDGRVEHSFAPRVWTVVCLLISIMNFHVGLQQSFGWEAFAAANLRTFFIAGSLMQAHVGFEVIDSSELTIAPWHITIKIFFPFM